MKIKKTENLFRKTMMVKALMHGMICIFQMQLNHRVCTYQQINKMSGKKTRSYTHKCQRYDYFLLGNDANTAITDNFPDLQSSCHACRNLPKLKWCVTDLLESLSVNPRKIIAFILRKEST